MPSLLWGRCRLRGSRLAAPPYLWEGLQRPQEQEPQRWVESAHPEPPWEEHAAWAAHGRRPRANRALCAARAGSQAPATKAGGGQPLPQEPPPRRGAPTAPGWFQERDYQGSEEEGLSVKR